MKWTSEKIENFKKNPLNQLAHSNPYSYLFVTCCMGFTFGAILFDIFSFINIEPFGHKIWFGKYVLGISVGLGTFLGQRFLWRQIKNIEKANKITSTE